MKRSAAGFTIVELLVATLIFSVVLLVISGGVLAFSRQYYKGVISTNTQSVARTIMDDVTRAIQFGGGGGVSTLTKLSASDTSTDTKGFCVGPTKRYSFAQSVQVSGTVKYGLVADTVSGCSTSTFALNVSSLSSLSSGRDLLGENMRVVKFRIDPVTGADNAYNVVIRVAYGDNDLLCSPTLPASGEGGCDEGAPAGGAAKFKGVENLKCRLLTGSEFCAVSELQTTVKMRLQ